MKRKLLPCIIGGSIGLVIGVLGGAFVGLVIGGTLLGGFHIYENIGIEGYELSTYVGALIGAIVLTVLGVKLASKLTTKQ